MVIYSSGGVTGFHVTQPGVAAPIGQAPTAPAARDLPPGAPGTTATVLGGTGGVVGGGGVATAAPTAPTPTVAPGPVPVTSGVDVLRVSEEAAARGGPTSAQQIAGATPLTPSQQITGAAPYVLGGSMAPAPRRGFVSPFARGKPGPYTWEELLAPEQKTYGDVTAGAPKQKPYTIGTPVPTLAAAPAPGRQTPTTTFKAPLAYGKVGPYEKLGPIEQIMLGATYAIPFAMPGRVISTAAFYGFGAMGAYSIAIEGPGAVIRGAATQPLLVITTAGAAAAGAGLPRIPKGVTASRAQTIGIAGLQKTGQFGDVTQLKGAGGYISAVEQRGLAGGRGAGVSTYVPKITALRRKPPLMTKRGLVETRATATGDIKSTFVVERKGLITSRLLGKYKRIERVEPAKVRGEVSPSLIEVEGIQFRKGLSEMRIGKEEAFGISQIRSTVKKGVTRARTDEISIGRGQIGRARGDYLGFEIPELAAKPSRGPPRARIETPREFTDVSARGTIKSVQKIYGVEKRAPADIAGAIGKGVEKGTQKALAKEIAKVEAGEIALMSGVSAPFGVTRLAQAPRTKPGYAPTQVQVTRRPRFDVGVSPKMAMPTQPKDMTVSAPRLEVAAPPKPWTGPRTGDVIVPRQRAPPRTDQPPIIKYKTPQQLKTPPVIITPITPISRIPYRPGRFIPIPLIPGGGLGRRMMPKFRYRAPRKGYRPSLAGVSLGVTIPRAPRGPFTGFGIRPVVRRKKKRK